MKWMKIQKKGKKPYKSIKLQPFEVGLHLKAYVGCGKQKIISWMNGILFAFTKLNLNW